MMWKDMPSVVQHTLSAAARVAALVAALLVAVVPRPAELMAAGWLMVATAGWLCGATLGAVDWHGKDLWGANLMDTDMRGANLKGIDWLSSPVAQPRSTAARE